MKLLVVAPQPFFSPRGTPFSVYYRTKVICELGHEVDLVTYGQGADVDIPGCRIVRIPKLAFLGRVPIGPSFLKLFLDCFMVAWTVGLLITKRYDVVDAHEESVFWCRWLKPIFRFRLIHDMHSSLPQQLDNFQYTRIGLVRWLFDRFERSAAQAAEVVITVCPALRDYARSLSPEPDKVFLIENSLYDPVMLRHEANTAGSADQAGAGDGAVSAEVWLATRSQESVITYTGTLEPYQGIKRLIEAFGKVVEEVPDASLLVVGGTSGEIMRLRSLADSIGLGESIHFTGQLPQARAQRFAAEGAASISPRLTGNNTPLKIYHLMASGIPLVATRIESHTQVLNDDIAILTGTESDQLADGMIKVLKNPEAAHGVAERAQRWYREHYSHEVYTAKMRDVFARLG